MRGYWKEKLIASAALILFAAGAAANPLYYTFQGVLDFTFGKEASGRIPYPQPATFVFMVDRDAAGYYTLVGAPKTYWTDDSEYDYYYAELVYSSTPAGGIYHNGLEGRFYGRDVISPFEFSQATDVFTRNQTVLRLSSNNIFDLQVGDQFDATSWISVSWINAGAKFSDPIDLSLSNYLIHQLRVTSISASSPVVPVPAAAWLLGSALAALGALRRRVC